MPHTEPRFCDATKTCHGFEARCYLTMGQHADGLHKGFCATRDGNGHLHAHYPEWPVMAEQTRTECGAA